MSYNLSGQDAMNAMLTKGIFTRGNYPWLSRPYRIKKIAVTNADIGADYVAGSEGSTKWMFDYVDGTWDDGSSDVRLTVFKYTDSSNPKFSTNIQIYNTTFGAADIVAICGALPAE